MTEIRLLAADLDGTLMDRDAILSPRLKAAVRATMEKGVRFTVATGRTFQATRPFAQELGTNAPLICYQGGLIRDPASGQTLYERAIPLPLAQEIVRFARERDLHLNVFLDDETYAERMRPEAEFYVRLSGVPLHPVGDLLAFLDRGPTKFMIISDEETTDRLAPELQALYAGKLNIVKSYRTFLEGMPAGVSKGAALAELAVYLGLDQRETLAIGDNDNDAEMVAWAGIGVAIGNASPAVLAVADYVAPPVWEDGAAQAVEKFILSEGG